MNRYEAAQLLTLAASRDNRSVGDANVVAWADDLADIDFDDAVDAVRAHFRESTDYLTIAHVRAAVKRIRAQRVADAARLEPPPVDPDDVAAYLAAYRGETRAIAEGNPPEPPQIEAAPRHFDYEQTFPDCPGRRGKPNARGQFCSIDEETA